eukprot:m.20201 g.20201  ORF g.20201 m.20201 type:complete len:549 (-) comp5549_c0_seq1:372-2018(-)
MASSLLLWTFTVSATATPSFLFVVVDDLGFNDVGFQNNATPGQQNVMQTPTIDALAKGGVILSDYTVYKYCSPSRTQMLVGRYAYHLGAQSSNLGPTNSGCAVSDDYDLIPAALKKYAPAKYATHAFGKYNLGFYAKRYTPTFRGFDTFHGFYDGGESHFTHITPFAVWKDPGIPYWWTPSDRKEYPPIGCGALVDMTNNSGSELRPASASLNGTFSAEITTAAVVDVLDRHPSPDQPIFLYVAFHAVHTPLEVPESYSNRYETLVADRDRRILGGMISAVDDGINTIVKKMQSRGLWNNTLVIFTTDNGGPICLNTSAAVQHGEKINKSCGTNNFPLRGSKMTYWQGGTRGIGFVSGPAIPPSARGTRHAGMVHQTDWYTTVLLLAGVSRAQLNATGPVPVDGVDQWSAITAGTSPPRSELVHNINSLGNEGAIRVGKWKLLKGWPSCDCYNANDGWWAPPEMGGKYEPSPEEHPCESHPCLFDLDADPEERFDLAQNRTDVLQQLIARYEELQKSEVSKVDAKLCVDVPNGCVANQALGVWQPWVE